jgi:hypothetical protein
MLISVKLQTSAKNPFSIEFIRKFLFREILKYYEIRIYFATFRIFAEFRKNILRTFSEFRKNFESFLLFLLNNIRIRIRDKTYWIRNTATRVVT